MKEIKVVDNIWRFEVSNGRLGWLTRDKKLYVEDKLIAEGVEEFRFWKDRLLIARADQLEIGPLDDFQPQHTYPGVFSLLFFHATDAYFFVDKRIDDKPGHYYRGNGDGLTGEFPIEGETIAAVSPDMVLTQRMTAVTARSISDGAVLWKIDTKELIPNSSIDGRYVVSYKDRIYFYLFEPSPGRAKGTFCLERTTGRVVHRVDDFGGSLRLHEGMIYATKVFYEVKTLDPETMATRVYNFESILKPKDLDLNDQTFQPVGDGLFYFVDGMIRTHIFGVIDLKKGELVKTVKLPIKERANKNIFDMRVQDGRVYVSAKDNRLYVYATEYV